MSTASQFGGGGGGRLATKGIQNRQLVGTGWVGYEQSGMFDLLVFVASGACTAGVYKTLLSVSGAGELNHCHIKLQNSTARSTSVRLTVDGTVVHESTRSSPVTGDDYLYFAIKGAPSIIFNTSLLIEVASSLTESNFCNLNYILHTF